MNRLLRACLIVLALYLVWGQWQQRAVAVHTAAPIAPAAPIQQPLARGAAPVFSKKGYIISAQASYVLEARLLSRKNYTFGREADLSPVDFALGWGPMSANALLEDINIRQSGRFYYLRWQNPQVRQATVMHNSANTHIIPANSTVAKRVKAMRPGQVVRLEGYLVNVLAKDNWHWHTSLSRTDTGAGACELFWVEHAEVVR